MKASDLKQLVYECVREVLAESTTTENKISLSEFKKRIASHEWYVEVRGSNKPTSLEKVGNSGTLLNKQLDAIAKFKIVGNTVYLTP